MSFKITPISNDEKKTITAWADLIIEQTKQKIYKGENYLIWDEIYYCKAGDAWIDEKWWIETAKTLLQRYNQEYQSWNFILPLEILAFYFPNELPFSSNSGITISHPGANELIIRKISQKLKFNRFSVNFLQ